MSRYRSEGRGHDYDMGFHAPWCGKCGAEDDAASDAEYAFNADKQAALLKLVKDARALLDAAEKAATDEQFKDAYNRADELVGLAVELTEKAEEKFSWPDHAEFGG